LNLRMLVVPATTWRIDSPLACAPASTSGSILSANARCIVGQEPPKVEHHCRVRGRPECDEFASPDPEHGSSCEANPIVVNLGRAVSPPPVLVRKDTNDDGLANTCCIAEFRLCQPGRLRPQGVRNAPNELRLPAGKIPTSTWAGSVESRMGAVTWATSSSKSFGSSCRRTGPWYVKTRPTLPDDIAAVRPMTSETRQPTPTRSRNAKRHSRLSRGL
jgi:hypothetical protein